MLTSILSYIKKLRDEIPRLGVVAFHQEKGPSVGVSQQSHVHQNLVTQHVNV